MVPILSVWSSYGHTFVSGPEYDEQGQGDESCLTCGAMYRLVVKENAPEALRGLFSDGAYITNSGEAPRWCYRDTGMVHGYPGERACVNPECDHEFAPCSHETHDCNCLQCD